MSRWQRSFDLFLGGLGARIAVLVLFLCCMLAAAWVLRVPVLRAIGDHLVQEDAHGRGDVLYVLGGAPEERGRAAARLLAEGAAPVAVCTGSLVPQSISAAGLALTEADLTRMAVLAAGGDSARVLLLQEGTSTWEEAGAILLHARSLGADTVLVLSTEFHSRRVRRVFRRRFADSGITVLVRNAPALRYDRRRWWASEDGLLMVNNEYVKALYYLLRY